MNDGSIAVREVHLGVIFRNKPFKVAKLSFATGDASLYAVPYGPTGDVRAGYGKLQAGVSSIDIPTQPCASAAHVSVHESGQVHIRTANETLHSCQVPHLAGFGGSHVGTIVVTALEQLAPLTRERRSSGKRPDVMLAGIPSDLTGLAIRLFVNGKRPAFDETCGITIRLARPHLSEPLFIGLSVRPETRLSGPNGCVMVISGWDDLSANLEKPAEVLILSAY